MPPRQCGFQVLNSGPGPKTSTLHLPGPFFEEVVQQVFSKAQPYWGLPDALPAETKGEVTVGIYYTCIVTRYLCPSPQSPLQLEKWAQRQLPVTTWFLMGS